MKQCCKCKLFKPLSEFNKNKSRSDSLQSYCRFCDNIRKKTYYRNNVTKFVAYSRKQRDKLKQDIDQYKALRGCCRCPETDSRCLDFHHIDPTNKLASIAEMLQKVAARKIWTEIYKCIVMCANCHRKHHA